MTIPARVTVLPATRSLYNSIPVHSTRKRRVAAYARVSTDSDEQYTSYTAQVSYYTEYIQRNPEWQFVDIYTDEGITGTSTKYREGFNRMIEDAGVELWVGAAFVDALIENGKVTGAIFATQNGLKAIRAKITVDSTGDACVAAAAGAEIEIGRESDGGLQPMTLEFTVTGVDESIAISVWGGSDPIKIPAGEFAGMEYRELCKQKNREGELPEFVSIVRLHRTSHPGERSVNATQVNNLSPLDPADMGKAELELRDQIKKCVDFLQKYIPGFENCSIKTSADTVGVRESRRVRGIEYIVDKDVEDGRHREDGIVHNAWFLIDIHNPKGGGQAEGYSRPAQPYDIPYGALVPIKTDGLLIAGRPISGTHRAHASWRVMAICMAMGEAAGVAASKCAVLDIEPRDLDSKEVRQVLTARGVEL